MKASFIDLLNSAPLYAVQRGSSIASTYQIYRATTEIAMWSDPDVENRLRDMDVNDKASFERKLPFGGVEMFYVIRVQ